MLKHVRIASPTMIVTDFMWCVTGKGGIFTVRIDDLPDYEECWHKLVITNDSDTNCFIRVTLQKSMDMYIESGSTKELALSDLRG